MKKLLPMLLALCLTLTLTAHALEESDIFYVNDPSSILSDSLKSHVVDENYRLYDLDEGAEVVLVAVDFLGGKTPESFAYDVFNDWALGDADENNGVLILLSPGEEKYWIMAGDGLGDVLPASTLDAICREAFADVFETEQYSDAAWTAFDDVVAQLDAKYGVSAADVDKWYTAQGAVNSSTWSQTPVAPGNSQPAIVTTPNDQRRSGPSLLTIIILLIILIFVLRTVFSFRRLSRRTYGAPRRSFWFPFLLGRTSARRNTYNQPRTPPPTDPGRPAGTIFGTGTSANRRSDSGSLWNTGSNRKTGSSSGSLFGGSSRTSSGGRLGGGGSSRGGGSGSSLFGSTRSSGSRSSFGSSSRSSSRSSSGSRSSGRSGGGRVGGGGSSRGGGAGRR